MVKSNVYGSCTNSSCENKKMLLIVSSINEEAAMETANKLNQTTYFCPKCGSYLVFYPHTPKDHSEFIYLDEN